MADKKILSFKKKNSYSESSQEVVFCSFCNRPNTQVPKMVKGPGVNICSECVMIALQYLIMQDTPMSSEAQKILDLLWGLNRK